VIYFHDIYQSYENIKPITLKYILSTYATNDSDTPITRIMSANSTGYSDTFFSNAIVILTYKNIKIST